MAYKPEGYRRHAEQRNLMDVDWSTLSPAELDMIAEAHLKKVLGTSDPKVLDSVEAD